MQEKTAFYLIASLFLGDRLRLRKSDGLKRNKKVQFRNLIFGLPESIHNQDMMCTHTDFFNWTENSPGPQKFDSTQ